MTVPPPGSSRRDTGATSSELAQVIADVAGAPPRDGREELREFFAAISGLGRRARRRYDEFQRPRTRRGLVVICGVLAIAGLLYQFSPRRPPSEMPPGLRGKWVTTAKSYADRGFWIGAHQVAFRVGPKAGDIQVYPVTHLAEKRISADTTLYDIDYAVDGGTDRWSIEQISLPRPAIVYLHQPQMTWTPTPDPHPPVR